MKDDVNGLKQGTVLRGTWTYTIDRVLGAGGFGITYLATGKGKAGNITVTLPFCIKEHYRGDLCERADDGTTVVCPGTATSRSQVADSLRDFVGEARRLLQVGADQPNIVKVNEIIEANGTAYYAMEFLNGHTLADLIIERSRKGQTLTEAEVEALVYPIVNAAAYIHTKKMTHLDIKPENIMLHQDDEGHTVPVLIDFGLSKHYNEDGSATSKVNTMGCSDGYAPSEQYQGITTFSPAADVYALGATILHCLTGVRPVKSNDWTPGEPAATINALPVSERLRTVIKRAMSLSRFDRYADAGAMSAALGAYAASAQSVGTIPIEIAEPKIVKPVEEPKTTEETRIAEPLKPSYEHEVVEVEEGKEETPVYKRKGLWIALAAAALVVLVVAWPKGPSEAEIREQIRLEQELAEAEREQQQEAAAERERQRQQQLEAERQRQQELEAERQHQQQLEAERQRQQELEAERQHQQQLEAERQRQAEAERERQRVNNLLTQAENYYNSGNYVQALPLYKEYYQASNTAWVATRIGYMYHMGQGTAQDYAEAVRWYRKAAEAGNPDGMKNLGNKYLNGQGVAQDYAEAVRWYRKAIAAGSIGAKNDLGYMYEKGYGVAQSRSEAFRLYTEAAQGGEKIAMYNLGNCYRYGRGVAQDREQAIYWYRKAAEKGYEDAKTQLREMGVSVN